jgi:hypothetical protein
VSTLTHDVPLSTASPSPDPVASDPILFGGPAQEYRPGFLCEPIELIMTFLLENPGLAPILVLLGFVIALIKLF